MKKMLLMFSILLTVPVLGFSSGQELECSHLKTKDNKDGPVIRIGMYPVSFDNTFFWVSIEGVGASSALGYRVGSREMSYVETDGAMKVEWKGQLEEGAERVFLSIDATKSQKEGTFNITSLTVHSALIPQVMLRTTLGQYIGRFENGNCRFISSTRKSTPD
jgi:hypothetical protein